MFLQCEFIKAKLRGIMSFSGNTHFFLNLKKINAILNKRLFWSFGEKIKENGKQELHKSTKFEQKLHKSTKFEQKLENSTQFEQKLQKSTKC